MLAIVEVFQILLLCHQHVLLVDVNHRRMISVAEWALRGAALGCIKAVDPCFHFLQAGSHSPTPTY